MASSIRDALHDLSKTVGLPDGVATALEGAAEEAGAMDTVLTHPAVGLDLQVRDNLRNSIPQVDAVVGAGFEDEGSDPLYPIFNALGEVLRQTPGVGPDIPDPKQAAELTRTRLIYIDACRLAAHRTTRALALTCLAAAIDAEPVSASWARKDPCFYELRGGDEAHARQFDSLTLSSNGGLMAIHGVSDELAAATKAFGIANREALRSASDWDLNKLASRHDVSRELVRQAAEVARMETNLWPGTETALTIHDANLMHTAAFASVDAFEEAKGEDLDAVLEKLRTANGSRHGWDGIYGSWRAIEELASTPDEDRESGG